MENRDELLRLQVKTKADRPVMNASDNTPEYINLATHYQERKAGESGLDSLEFTENSINYLSAFEDENLINGNVQPKVTGHVGYTASGKPITMTEGYVPPYRDIPGNFATVGEPVFYKEKKSEPYKLVPVSVIPFYNPVVLALISLLLIFLIIVEVLGVIYVY